MLKWVWETTEPESAEGARRMKRYWDKVTDEWVYEAYDVVDVTYAPEDNEQGELSEGKEEEKNLVLLLSSLR